MVSMPNIDGIRMLGNRLVRMNIGRVMVPFAAMLMGSREMRVRRRPLDSQEDGQQNEITQGAEALFDQLIAYTVKSAWILS